MIRGDLKLEELNAFVAKMRWKADVGRKEDVASAMHDSFNSIIGKAQEKYLTSGPLHRRTGRLASSLKARIVSATDKKIVGSVGTNVFYGRVWEFGAQTPGHIVRPVRAKMLAWKGGAPGAHGVGTGGWVFARQVKLAPKPWLDPSVKDRTAYILDRFAKANLNLLSKKG